ncbi:hypothetical protein GIB67_021242 [Kingdonia uniflora]|uniref:Uncharacterized protein n=1 Tax=Kingdonia uniflora TaxID=39325 RepID=A0A7J7LFJ2_9MAGN|nr:hypothetical protein GIB67_021242 [Kingdonia uniflora]
MEENKVKSLSEGRPPNPFAVSYKQVSYKQSFSISCVAAASLNFELAKDDDASNGIHGSNIVDLDVPRSFWNRLAGKYGNMFYWKEKQRCLHDEVAQCEKTLKTLLNGGQEDLMSKVDSTVEACDDTLSLGVTQTSLEQCQNHVEERSLESFKKRKLSESTLSLDNPCQVFSCLGLFSDEKNLIEDISYQFRAKVMVRRKDFVHSVDWEQGSNPLEARVSAARQMLIKLRSVESQASKFSLLTSCTSKGSE